MNNISLRFCGAMATAVVCFLSLPSLAVTPPVADKILGIASSKLGWTLSPAAVAALKSHHIKDDAVVIKRFFNHEFKNGAHFSKALEIAAQGPSAGHHSGGAAAAPRPERPHAAEAAAKPRGATATALAKMAPDERRSYEEGMRSAAKRVPVAPPSASDQAAARKQIHEIRTFDLLMTRSLNAKDKAGIERRLVHIEHNLHQWSSYDDLHSISRELIQDGMLTSM